MAVPMNKALERKPRSYKINDSRYKRAMRRAKKDGLSLATFIEDVVTAYSNNFEICFIEKPKDIS